MSQDIELASKMFEKNISVDEIYQLSRQRLYLFEKSSDMPLTRYDRLLLNSKKVEMSMELKLFRFMPINVSIKTRFIARVL